MTLVKMSIMIEKHENISFFDFSSLFEYSPDKISWDKARYLLFNHYFFFDSIRQRFLILKKILFFAVYFPK